LENYHIFSYFFTFCFNSKITLIFKNSFSSENVRWIKDATRRQFRALEALKMVSPELYKSAVSSEHCGLPSIMEGFLIFYNFKIEI